MKHCMKTEHYELTYSETHVESRVLWDSHCHARYEMIAVLEGDISVMLEGQSLRLTENQFIMIPPLLYHTVTANKQGDYKRITALFDLRAVPPILQDGFTQLDSAPPISSSPSMELLRNCCQREGDVHYAPLAESLMIPLFYARLQAPAADPRAVTADELTLSIIRYVDRHLCDRITLEDLARHTARSKSFICHRFEEAMGIPPGRYVLQKKLAFAQKMIREGHPPSLVAAQIGYKNYGTFYRMYRKQFQSIPSGDRGEKKRSKPPFSGGKTGAQTISKT